MSLHIREKELQNLGLTEKESKVYLASLELGESPVQDIARKAGVNRATTYVMIEQLTAKGLMSSLERGKKRYFLAESPDKLMTGLRLEVAELEEKMQNFRRVLPDLHTLYDTSGERPRVRFFEGEEGVLSVMEEFHNDVEPGVEARLMTNHDDYIASFGVEDRLDKHKEKLRSVNYHTRALYVCDEAAESKHGPTHNRTFEVRRLPKNLFPFNGEMGLMKNRAYFWTYKGKMTGIIIENEQIVSLLSAMFDLAWAASEKIAVSKDRSPNLPPVQA